MLKPVRKFPFLLNYSTIFLLVLVFVISRCKKESAGAAEDNSISISFSSSSVSYDLVDSAIVTFTKGSAIVKMIMEKKDRLLKASLNELDEGQWTAAIGLYTRVPNDNYPRRYDMFQTIGLSGGRKGIRLPAPTKELFNDQWKPRVIITNQSRSVVLTVALDPNDPYTDLAVSDPSWDYSYIDRTALYKNAGGEERTDGGSWECDNDCFADGIFQFEPNAFNGFSQRMANRDWSRSEVYGLLMNTATGEEMTLYYLYKRE